ADVLDNAFSFFRTENADLAAEIIARAERAFPSDPRWPVQRRTVRLEKLSVVPHTWLWRALPPPAEAETLLAAVEHELRSPGASRLNRVELHLHAARFALHLGQLMVARSHAEAILAEVDQPTENAGRPDGDLLHFGHNILGRIELRAGDVERASAH